MDNSDIERSNNLVDRTQGRISPEGIEATNINSYIASLTDATNLPGANEVNPDHKRNMERAVGMYSYLRDKTGAQTVGEAWSSLRKRKVDQGVVKLWVEEEMAINPGLFDAVSEGYPELKDDLQKVRDAYVNRVISKK